MSEARSAAELLDALARPTSLCAFCPKMCRSACPVSEAEGRETVTPWAKMSLVHLARTGQGSLGSPGARQALEACTGCGACVEKCAHGNPVAETLFAARGVAQAERIGRHRAQFEATGDVKGRDHRPALEGITKSRSSRVAYFPGCTRATVDGPAAVRRDLRALSRALDEDVPACDIGPPSEGKAQCCGYPLYVDGQLDLVEDNLLRLGELLAGHDLVVTPDPGCAYMLSTVQSVLVGKRGRGKTGARPFPAVLPLVEVLAQRADRFRDAARGVVVRYHDPCYLGRRGRTFEAPRRLLEAATGRPSLEFYKNRDEADCSGGGGLYPTSNPDGARAMARRRVSHDGAAHEAAELVVTACPSARRGFQRAGHRAVDVVDVILGEIEKDGDKPR
jgi:Fe-S oxidoreductase